MTLAGCPGAYEPGAISTAIACIWRVKSRARCARNSGPWGVKRVDFLELSRPLQVLASP